MANTQKLGAPKDWQQALGKVLQGAQHSVAMVYGEQENTLVLFPGNDFSHATHADKSPICPEKRGHTEPPPVGPGQGTARGEALQAAAAPNRGQHPCIAVHFWGDEHSGHIHPNTE